MKKIVLFIATIALFSCSNDDDKSDVKQALAKATVVDENGTSVYEFTYDDKKKIQTLKNTYANTVTFFDYTYNSDGLISQVRYTKNNAPLVATLSYDSKKHLTAINSPDYNYTLTYVAETNSYTIQNIVIELNNDGNIVSFSNIGFSYDSKVKGGLYGLKSNFSLVTAIFDQNSIFISSTHPISEVVPAADVDQFTVTNSTDDNNYVTKTSINSKDDSYNSPTVTFEYN